jgi:oligosaccharide repeat unit polymerase
MSIGYFLPRWWLAFDWDWLPSGPEAGGWIALVIIGSLAIYPWVSRIGRRIDYFEPVYFASLLFLLVFFLRPIQILYDHRTRANLMPDDPQLFQNVLLLGALGFICFYIGYKINIGISIGRRLPKFGERWRHDRVIKVAVVFLLIGVAGYSLAAARSGGLGLFLSTLRGRKLISETESWSIASTVVLLRAAPVILGAYYFKTKRLRALFIASLLLSVAFNLMLGNRSSVLVPLLALLVIAYYLRRPKVGRLLRRTMVIGVFAGIILLFIIIQVSVRMHLLRGGAVSDLSLKSLATEDVSGRFLDEFNQFDWFVVVLEIVPSELPFQYGKSFAEVFTRFVPRAIWPDKPAPISKRINMMLGGARSGHPPTILGELYLNFSVLGVIAGMVVFGILLRAMYAYLLYNQGNPAVILIYAYTFASLHRFFTRTFAPKMFGYLLFMIPIVLALRFIAPDPKRRVGRGT